MDGLTSLIISKGIHFPNISGPQQERTAAPLGADEGAKPDLQPLSAVHTQTSQLPKNFKSSSLRQLSRLSLKSMHAHRLNSGEVVKDKKGSSI